jgi:hypothetical protein
MFDMIENTSDNYVKLEGSESESGRISNSDSRMIIKLAYYSERGQADDISTCCELNGSLFIPLIENKFGILNEVPWKVSYGQDSSDGEENFKIKGFVDVYNCVSNLEKSKIKYKLWKKNLSPYIGELLDNKFFLNILFVVSTHKKLSVILKVQTKSGEVKDLENVDEIKNGFKKKYIKRILNLSFNFNGKDVFIDKSGYIDISSNLDFFRENEEAIKDLLITGFREDYGKYYL